jgi:hypothetical protein
MSSTFGTSSHTAGSICSHRKSDPTVDKSPPIVMMDDVNKELSSTSYKQQKLPAAYEALKKSGFTFTSYEER